MKSTALKVDRPVRHHIGFGISGTLQIGKRRRGARFSPAALDFFARLESAPEGNLRINAFDKANAELIDRLVGNGGNFWPESGAFVPMAGYLFPGTDTGAGQRLIPLRDSHDAGRIYAAVEGDWNAVTGLKGNGSTIYVDSNRNNNADGQNNIAFGTWVTTHQSGYSAAVLMGARSDNPTGSDQLIVNSVSSVGRNRAISRGIEQDLQIFAGAGYRGVSRVSETAWAGRANQTNTTGPTTASQTRSGNNFYIFARSQITTPNLFSDARSSFYHIGPNLSGTGELAEMDAGLAKWVADLAAAALP